FLGDGGLRRRRGLGLGLGLLGGRLGGGQQRLVLVGQQRLGVVARLRAGGILRALARVRHVLVGRVLVAFVVEQAHAATFGHRPSSSRSILGASSFAAFSTSVTSSP